MRELPDPYADAWKEPEGEGEIDDLFHKIINLPFEEKEIIFRKALAEESSAEALCILADHLSEPGVEATPEQKAEAEELYDQALALDPDRLQTLHSVGNFNRACKQDFEAAEARPNQTASWSLLAPALNAIGK